MKPKLCIGKSPFLLEGLARKGHCYIGRPIVYRNGILKSFEDSRTKFGIPNSQFFTYLQLCYLLSGSWDLIYQLPNLQSNGALWALKKTWERDLNLMLDDGVWDGICKNIKTMSRDAKVHFMQFKIMHCFCWLFRLSLIPTSNCWRCKSEEGHLVNALWSCNKVQEVWARIHDLHDISVWLQRPKFHSVLDYLY